MQPIPTTEAPSASGLRSVITLLLIVHLFALAVGVLSSARPVSPLRNQLADVPFVAQYLQLISMDLAYNFHLSDGLESDFDHFVELTPRRDESSNADVDDPSPSMTLPPSGIRLGIRRERYQRLALDAATAGGEDPVRKTLLPKAIAKAILRQRNLPAGNYRLRIQRRAIIDLEEASSTQPELNDPYHERRLETAYEGVVIASPQRVDFVEIAPEEQRAGVRTQSNPRSRSQP